MPYALVLDGVNNLALRERRPPPLDSDQVLVESWYAAICGTDLEVIAGTSNRAAPPLILGHEWVGRVAEVGPSVATDLAGKLVVGDNRIPCGGCDSCLNGNTAACARAQEIGFELPGGFSSHFAIAARNLRQIPASLAGAHACLIEPLAVSVRAVRAGCLTRSDSVLVIGDGVVGLLVARLATLAQPRSVTLVGRHSDRLEIARRLGLRLVFRQGSLPFGSTQSEAWSTVFEASGSVTGIETAVSASAPEGRVVLAGDYGSAAVPIDATTIVRNELHLLGTNASAGAWDEAVRLASSGAVDLRLITQLVFPVDEWSDAINAARARRAPRVVLQHRVTEDAP